jgi:hypothetical protein
MGVGAKRKAKRKAAKARGAEVRIDASRESSRESRESRSLELEPSLGWT